MCIFFMSESIFITFILSNIRARWCLFNYCCSFNYILNRFNSIFYYFFGFNRNWHWIIWEMFLISFHLLFLPTFWSLCCFDFMGKQILWRRIGIGIGMSIAFDCFEVPLSVWNQKKEKKKMKSLFCLCIFDFYWAFVGN